MTLQEQYADLVMNKEKFLDTLRAFVEGVIRHIPEPFREEWAAEMFERIMNLYDAEFPAYREAVIKTLGEVYTEEQLGIMLEFYTQNPWAYEKSAENMRKTNLNTHDIDERVITRMDPLIESFIEEKEGKSEEL